MVCRVSQSLLCGKLSLDLWTMDPIAEEIHESQSLLCGKLSLDKITDQKTGKKKTSQSLLCGKLSLDL